MRKLLFLFLVIGYSGIYCQDTLKTYYGDQIYPIDTFRVLNIFINIHYDLCDTCDPYRNETTPNWMPGPPNTVNESLPVYLDDFMDSDFNPGNIRGAFTKRFAEASFNKFIVLGDHVVVNIKQSDVNPSGGTFNQSRLLDSCISLINQHGGLQTKNGHNSISDYDGSHTLGGLKFKSKPQNFNDNRIDFIQVFFRNCTKKYGNLKSGGYASIDMYKPLIINGIPRFKNAGTVQGAIGNTDLSNPMANPAEVHELAHNLIGMTNSAHMGGGGPLDVGDLVTLEANRGGWSLLGSATSSMLNCNGFERWRLDWRGPTNNAYPIAAGNLNSDIEKSPGTKTFYLRDFITYGDAIRIKLPYKDNGVLNQYIWLENHQLIHNTGKIDYPAWWMAECKDDGAAGIYAYYQVGKDIRESTSYSDMLPGYTDHLVPICADGNWDVRLLSEVRNISCIAWSDEIVQEYYQENPLSGYNDLSEHFFNPASVNTLNTWRHSKDFIIKKKNGIILPSKLANMGDNEDPFTGNSSMNISTNPAPVNVVTYHNRRPSYTDTSSSCTSGCKGQIDLSSRINNRKIHLSGLRIDMSNQGNGTYKVDIRWDDYNVSNSVRWTGDIVLHEQVNLLSGKKITLDQNYTPNKHIRDAVTGLFAGPTYFTCLNGSSFTMQPNSQVELNNLSSFILEQGSTLEIKDGAVFTVKSGCTMQVKYGANLIVRGSGKIEIENGGHFCLEGGGHISLQDYMSVINLRNGHILGVNTDVLADPGNCVEVVEDFAEYKSGLGKINTFSTNTYIQNKTFTHDEYIAGNNIYVGYNVTNPPYGNVVIPNGVKVIFDPAGEVNFATGFEVSNGANFELRK